MVLIASITVTYQPDLTILQRQLTSICEEVEHMLVIDNGSAAAGAQDLRTLCKDAGAKLVVLKSNAGIGHAQNIGIQIARTLNADMVMLLDQDSEAMPHMVQTLRHALTANPNAAAVGPSTFDVRTGRSFFFPLDFVNGLWPKLWSPTHNQPTKTVEVAALIASGTLIRATAIPDREPMLASWFIDHVDSEWCFRIRAEGWLLLGVPSAQLSHTLGDKVTRIWFLRWRQVAHHSPLRDFYMFRNTLLLTKKPYVSWRWKLYLLARLGLFAGFFLTFTPQRLLRVSRMVRGVFDGIRGRTGPYQ